MSDMVNMPHVAGIFSDGYDIELVRALFDMIEVYGIKALESGELHSSADGDNMYIMMRLLRSILHDRFNLEL